MRVAQLKSADKRLVNGGSGPAVIKTDYVFKGHKNCVTIVALDPRLAMSKGAVLTSHFFEDDALFLIIQCGEKQGNFWIYEGDELGQITVMAMPKQDRKGKGK